jgi:hypothetical protein
MRTAAGTRATFIASICQYIDRRFSRADGLVSPTRPVALTAGSLLIPGDRIMLKTSACQ